MNGDLAMVLPTHLILQRHDLLLKAIDLDLKIPHKSPKLIIRRWICTVSSVHTCMGTSAVTRQAVIRRGHIARRITWRIWPMGRSLKAVWPTRVQLRRSRGLTM